LHFESFLDEAEARTRIQDTLLRFCRGVDRKDWDMLLSAFHEDASDDHGWVSGSPSRDLVPALRERHRDVEHSSHMITNVSCDFLSANNARVESYGLVSQRSAPDDSGKVRRMQATVRYVDHLERRGRGEDWLIATRVLVYGDSVVTVLDAPFTPAPGSVVQRRDGSDPLELLEKAVR
jgi:hypothetical protein